MRRAGRGLAGAAMTCLLAGTVACSAGTARSEESPSEGTPLRQLDGAAAPSSAAPSSAAPSLTSPSLTTPSPATATPPAVDESAVLAELRAVVQPAGVSLDAVVIDEDATALLSTPDADQPVPSASLVKLLVVQQLLARSAAGVLSLGPTDLERMERAITASDDRAMSLLWDAHDGAALVRSAAAGFDLTGTAPPEQRGQWGEAEMSAADTGHFLAALTAGAPGGETLLGWMRDASPNAADGFDQRFGLLADGTAGALAAKQGWMCCVAGQRHLHSVGVLGDGRTVVLLGEAPSSASFAQLRRALDEAAAVLVAGTA